MAFLGDPDIPDFKLTFLNAGQELSLDGGIKYGLASSFETFCRRHCCKDCASTEYWGRIAEAKLLFGVIRARGLDTYVSGECDSACTLVFAGGAKRWLLDGAKLGYHSGSFAGLNQNDMRLVNADWAEIFRISGMSPAFVQRALSVPASSIWHPTNAELLEAGAVTNITDGGRFALDGHEAGPQSKRWLQNFAKGPPCSARWRLRFQKKHGTFIQSEIDICFVEVGHRHKI